MHIKKTKIRKIREHLGYDYQDMADELKLNKSTYQGYDQGRRSTPNHVLEAARVARKRVDNFMKGIPARVDENLVSGICPNEATRGAW